MTRFVDRWARWLRKAKRQEANPPPREVTMYVSLCGDDANDGMTPDAAKKTISGAIEELKRLAAERGDAPGHLGRVDVLGLEGLAQQQGEGQQRILSRRIPRGY